MGMLRGGAVQMLMGDDGPYFIGKGEPAPRAVNSKRKEKDRQHRRMVRAQKRKQRER